MFGRSPDPFALLQLVTGATDDSLDTKEGSSDTETRVNTQFLKPLYSFYATKIINSVNYRLMKKYRLKQNEILLNCLTPMMNG